MGGNGQTAVLVESLHLDSTKIEQLISTKLADLKLYLAGNPDPNLSFVYCELDNIEKLRAYLANKRRPRRITTDTRTA